jgi:hypothetical protein
MTDLIFSALLVLAVAALIVGIAIDYKQTYGKGRRD